jgi:GNAT superfamily N-acetyltransferase
MKNNCLRTFYLEMTSQSELIEKSGSEGLQIVEAEIKEFRFNRYLYTLVGEKWGWTDKLNFTDEQWREYAESENRRTWVAYSQGSIAGYFELDTDAESNVEISYFGLAPKFIGQGLGGYLLSSAIKIAWEQCHAKRVWVHTCTLDHPNALRNYQSRGMRVYCEESNDAEDRENSEFRQELRRSLE